MRVPFGAGGRLAASAEQGHRLLCGLALPMHTRSARHPPLLPALNSAGPAANHDRPRGPETAMSGLVLPIDSEGLRAQADSLPPRPGTADTDGATPRRSPSAAAAAVHAPAVFLRASRLLVCMSSQASGPGHLAWLPLPVWRCPDAQTVLSARAVDWPACPPFWQWGMLLPGARSGPGGQPRQRSRHKGRHRCGKRSVLLRPHRAA